MGRKLGRFEYVDHINGNCLDNRRSNLRVATPSQNSQNKSGSSAQHRTSAHKGVSWKSRDEIWVAQILVNKLKIHLGYFQGEQDAAIQYDCAARFYFGEFARVNFPDIPPDSAWKFSRRIPSSEFRGVSFNRGRGKKWTSRGGWGGRVHTIGYFDAEVEAAKAYDKAIWGNTDRGLECLNFPEEYVAYA